VIANNKLTIYLIKGAYSSGTKCIKNHVKPIVLRPIGSFYTEPSASKTPTWVKGFFNERIQQAIIFTANAKGVLLTSTTYKRKKIVFAVCFGLGHNLLRPESVEESFGLKVTLNSVDKDSIRSIEKSNIGANSKISKEQMAKSTNATEFGIDIEQDLLRAVTGISKYPQLGRTVTGSDSLHVYVKVDINSIQEFLRFCYTRYLSKDYLIDFDWVDQIQHVKNPTLIEKLEAVVLKKYNNRDFDTLWMAVPDLLDWNTLRGFKYYPRQEDPSDDIDLQVFRTAVGEIEDITQLNTRYVHALSSAGDFDLAHWSSFKCLYGEIKYYRKHYLLNGGKWYIIDNDFVKLVNGIYSKIALSKISLLDYDHDNEGAYNNALANSNSQYQLMDKKEITYGGGKSKIEFCDVFSKTKKMIFVKHYGASAVLSHFFQQGMNSAEYLNSDPSFRAKVNKLLAPGWALPNPSARLRTEKFEIIFAIISRDPKNRPEIPFFSKVSLKNVVRRLKNYRYHVSIKKITSLKKG
jgi:uncharacterized protein (TIGR04141 family)